MGWGWPHSTREELISKRSLYFRFVVYMRLSGFKLFRSGFTWKSEIFKKEWKSINSRRKPHTQQHTVPTSRLIAENVCCYIRTTSAIKMGMEMRVKWSVDVRCRAAISFGRRKKYSLRLKLWNDIINNKRKESTFLYSLFVFWPVSHWSSFKLL